MAQLSKRTRMIGSGGAGPFHLPQKPGRTNHLTHGWRVRRDKRAPVSTAAVDAVAMMLGKQQRRSVFRRAFDKLGRKAA